MPSRYLRFCKLRCRSWLLAVSCDLDTCVFASCGLEAGFLRSIKIQILAFLLSEAARYASRWEQRIFARTLLSNNTSFRSKITPSLSLNRNLQLAKITKSQLCTSHFATLIPTRYDKVIGTLSEVVSFWKLREVRVCEIGRFHTDTCKLTKVLDRLETHKLNSWS